MTSEFDHLYGLPADEFVAARNQLVTALRTAGERQLATEVKALRRPNMIAAELNRVLRHTPDDLAALLATALRLRDGQQEVLAGSAVDVHALRDDHRRAVGILAERAARRIDDVRVLLETISLDEGQHQALRAATFTDVPTATQGFDLLTPDPTVRSMAEARSRRDRRASQAKEVAAEKQQQAQAALILAERRIEAAQRSAAKATERIADLEHRLSEARAHLTTVEASLAAAVAAKQRLTIAPTGDLPD